MLAPRVTVLVATYQGDARIRMCLDSLAAQSLAPEEFEVLVVQNGPPCRTPQVVAEFRSEHPRVRIRLLELSQPGLSHARNVGLLAARGTFVTYVDDDDWVTPSYLERLLELADDDDVVPVALVSTVVEGTTDTPSNTPDLDNYVSASLRPHSGRTVTCDQAPSALSFNAGKLVRTEIARQLKYDETLRSGEDFVYWLTLLSRHPFRLRVVETGDDVLYCRSIREGSLGRQGLNYDFMVTQRLDCLAAIDAVDVSDPVVSRVARVLRNAQASRIREYLTQRPGEQATVVADVRRRGMASMPWPVVNRGRARDLAFVFCFPPNLDTSGLVAARRLRERGVVTDVISTDMSAIRSQDRGATEVAAEVIDQTKVLKTPPTFENWPAISQFAEQAVATAAAWEQDKGSYRSVYSRSMMIGSHFAAALMKARRPEVEWIAEFSDPLKFQSVGEVRPSQIGDNWLRTELDRAASQAGRAFDTDLVFEFTELITYALADRIIFTNANQMELMLGYCLDARLRDRARQVAEVSPHPTLPTEFYHRRMPEYPIDNSVVNVAYFGVFYLNRGLDEITAAITSLRYSVRSRLRLHVFTSEPENLRIEATQAGLSDVLVPRPFVSYLDFLALSTRFDALLVNDAETRPYFPLNPYLPSKFSDYLGSGSPIWAVTEPGSILDSSDTTYVSRLGDAAGARAVLEQLVRNSQHNHRNSRARVAT